MTSHDVVDQLRKIFGVKKIGHAGTLDPLATGVLVIGVGREATKKLAIEVQKEKEYLAEITLGVTSTTDDEEGIKTKSTSLKNGDKKPPTLTEVKAVTSKFIGQIKQTPPVYSAVKIKGQEAYKRVRKGEKVELNPREVKIKAIEILNYQWPKLELKIITGPGVYIRAIARDVGEALNVGGYLSGLTRTRVGEFTLADAYQLSDL